MVRAAKLGLGGSVIGLVGWVVGFESAVWRTTSIFGEVRIAVGIVVLSPAYLARLIDSRDLANKGLGPPSNSDDRKWWQG